MSGHIPWGRRPDPSRPYTMFRGVSVAGIRIDPVLWRRLAANLSEEDVERFVAHAVRLGNTSQQSIIYSFLTEGRDSMSGWTLAWRDGSIGLSADIGNGTTRIAWKDGIIVLHGIAVASTMAQALRGRPLGNLIEHPLLPANDPIAAVNCTGQTTTVTMAVNKVPKAA